MVIQSISGFTSDGHHILYVTIQTFYSIIGDFECSQDLISSWEQFWVLLGVGDVQE